MPISSSVSRARFGLTAVLTIALATPALAQKGADDPDMKAIAAYHLTMAKFNALDHAMHDMAAELKKDPRFQQHMKEDAELEALQNKDNPTAADQKRIEALEAADKRFEDAMGDGVDGDNATLAQMAAGIKKLAPLANALQKNGISPQEYATFTMAMLQASMAAALKKSGQLKELPAGVNAENVKFVLDHEAEITRLQQAWSSLGESK